MRRLNKIMYIIEDNIKGYCLHSDEPCKYNGKSFEELEDAIFFCIEHDLRYDVLKENHVDYWEFGNGDGNYHLPK